MKHLIALLVLIIPVFLGSCTTSPTAPPYDGPGLYGQVMLEDSTGTPIMPPYSGIIVFIPGFSDTVRADALGKWNITSPPQGNYSLIFSKDGFGSTSFQENYVITISPGSASESFSEPGMVVLTQAPDSIVRVENVLVFDSTSPWIPAGIYVSVTATSPRVFIFIDTVPNIPSTGVHLSDPMELYEHHDNEFDDPDPEDLSYLGLRHGQRIYITACAASAATGWKYVGNGNQVQLSNVGPSSNAYWVDIP